MSKEKKSYEYCRKNIWESSDEAKKAKIFATAERYKQFLDEVRTEREGVVWIKHFAESEGFRSIDYFTKLSPGDKVYIEYESKNIALAIIGKEGLKPGLNIIGAHLDSPRLDLKIHPLIEEEGIALLKTQYYGGIKKYQWLNIPLALHGVLFKIDGTKIDIVIGEKDSDPVFVISDLLPHLSRKIQGEKNLLDGIDGENLSLFAGTMPSCDSKIRHKVKARILEILYETYGFTEEDFISAEIEIVPSLKTKDVGFDRSMVGGYGHDDRVCSYASVIAILNIKDVPKRTVLAFLTDKEEIGSKGISGSDSHALPNTIAELLYREDSAYHDIEFRRTLNRSFCLSADVGSGYNPLYPSVYDKHNAAFIGSGIIIKKYTGSGGKSGASDASAELVSKIRKIFTDAGVLWQASSMGKVDEGGGGTIAMFVAQFGIPVIDCGIGVVGMHSPYELISKADLYHLIKGYEAFYRNA